MDLHRQIILLGVLNEQKHLRLFLFLFHGTALPGAQGNIFRVIHAAELPVHQTRKYQITKAEHPRHAPEIVAQLHADASGRFFHFVIPVIAGQKQIRSRLPEPVDTLLHISHHEQVILPFSADCIEYRLLHQVGILIFVHKNCLIFF